MPKAEKTIRKDIDFATDIKNSLIANINHALRTPLNGVVGMMDLLTKTGLTKDQIKYMHVVRESTEHLMLQLDNILELAKIEDGELIVTSEDCRLKDIVKEALQHVISHAVKKSILISVEYGFDLPEIIKTDEHKLRLALINLFSCAIRFAERGKVVLKITKEQLGDDENPDYKLRFTLKNSKILYDALHGSLEQYEEMQGTDLQEFGEITVSLLTTQNLLKTLGAHINFDHLKEGHEPPFHFDLDLVEGTGNVAESSFSVLEGKRALILQNDILEMTTLLQCLNLWHIDTRHVSDAEEIPDELTAAYREGRNIDLLFLTEKTDGKMLAALKEKVPHIIKITADTSLNEALLSELSAHLIPPVYPEELLSALSSLYRDANPDEEKSLSATASHLISGVQYEDLPAKVLLVEDDTTSRLYATELLEGFGCTVTTAENGEQALIKMMSHPDYDAVFMDCMMPRMDGYSATKELRAAGHDIPIIALTANTLERDKEKCLAAGMSDYITKPVREQDLHDMLKKHLK